MRINCVGLADLLCAYADGELTESNKQIVEDHLAICENCSAILKVYREISDSVSDTNVPAPESLRIGVMNRVRDEDTPRATNTNKLRRRYQVILTRYAPIAACLVVMLLVWQFWGDMWGIREYFQENTSIPAAAPEAMPAPQPPANAPPAPQAAIHTTDDMAELGRFDDEGVASSADAPQAAPAGTADFEDTMLTGESRSAQETESIMAYISGAYAEIAIVGEFPAFLAGYEPQPFGSWFGWERVFEIPSSEVAALIAELGIGDGVEVAYHDNNSTYAVVLFSPG